MAGTTPRPDAVGMLTNTNAIKIYDRDSGQQVHSMIGSRKAHKWAKEQLHDPRVFILKQGFIRIGIYYQGSRLDK